MKTIVFFFLFTSFAGCNNSTGTADVTQRDSIGNIIDSIDYCLDCYSFVIRKTKHKESVNQKDCDCEDLETYDYVFPGTVKVLKRTGEGWQLIKTKNVTSFEQLGRLKLNTIFDID